MLGFHKPTRHGGIFKNIGETQKHNPSLTVRVGIKLQTPNFETDVVGRIESIDGLFQPVSRPDAWHVRRCKLQNRYNLDRGCSMQDLPRVPPWNLTESTILALAVNIHLNALFQKQRILGRKTVEMQNCSVRWRVIEQNLQSFRSIVSKGIVRRVS